MTASTMEERSKVAAATAAVVPFHCVICFDSFCLKERLPVVLPCGHTFVCAPCSKRLKRCMECREPLFYTVPKNSGSNNAALNRGPPPAPTLSYSRDYARYSPTPTTPSTPPNPSMAPHGAGGAVHPSAVTQVMYPIPKNVVLISMMEVAERQAREQKALLDETDGSMEANDDDDEEYDLNRIISGMATISGPCGTYAVKEPEGLALHSSDPAEIDVDDEDDINLEPHRQLAVSASDDSVEVKHPSLLEKGQTVQVVAFENGVAKLARGAGYVIANSNQLVKVGGPLDASCRLEGLLDTVVNRGSDLQKELDENNRIEESLRREIAAEHEKAPSHPIVADKPKIEDSIASGDAKETQEPTTPTPNIEGLPRTPDVSPETAYIVDGLRVGRNGITAFGKPATFPFSPNSIDNADLGNPGLPGYRRNTSRDESDFYGCGFLGGHVRLFADAEQPSSPIRMPDHGNASPTRMVDHGNENRLRAASADGHPNLSPTLTSSFDTIDFRTGMSGHRGLNNTKKMHAGHSPIPRSRLMMSEHRGIGRARGPLHRSATNSPSPSPP